MAFDLDLDMDACPIIFKTYKRLLNESNASDQTLQQWKEDFCEQKGEDDKVELQRNDAKNCVDIVVTISNQQFTFSSMDVFEESLRTTLRCDLFSVLPTKCCFITCCRAKTSTYVSRAGSSPSIIGFAQARWACPYQAGNFTLAGPTRSNVH